MRLKALAAIVVAALAPLFLWTWKSIEPVRGTVPGMKWTKAASARFVTVLPSDPLLIPGSTIRLSFESEKRDEGGTTTFRGPGVGGIMSVSGSISVAGHAPVSMGDTQVPPPAKKGDLRGSDAVAEFTLPAVPPKSSVDLPAEMTFVIEYQEYRYVGKKEGFNSTTQLYDKEGVSTETLRARGTMLGPASAARVRGILKEAHRRTAIFALTGLTLLLLFYFTIARFALDDKSGIDLLPAMLALASGLFLLWNIDSESPGAAAVVVALLVGFFGGGFLGTLLLKSAAKLVSRPNLLSS